MRRLVFVVAVLIVVGILLAVFWGPEALYPFIFIAILGLAIVALTRYGGPLLQNAGRANYERKMRPPHKTRPPRKMQRRRR